MNTARLLCTLLLTSPIAGCDQISNLFGPATIKSFDECFQKGKQAGSTKIATIRAACIERHQSKIPDVLSGKADYKCSPEDEWLVNSDGQLYVEPKTKEPVLKNAHLPRICEHFDGRLTNNSANHIVTSVTVHLRHNDSSQPESKTFTGLWLEKDQSFDFSFPVNFTLKRANGNDSLKDKFRWWTETAKGFVVDY